jgi:hypothetical protein
MPAARRTVLALLAYPAGWAVREALGGGQGGGAVGGVVVFGLVAACALGLPLRRALGVAALGVACFVAVHVIAALTAIYLGLVVGALAFATLGSLAWRSSSSARPATPAS